jgi:hypothetical protein
MRTNSSIAIVALFAVGVVCGLPPSVWSAEKASATLTLEAKSVAAGVGWTWGGGVLRYGGRKYRFKVEGLALNAAGVEQANATGYVYGLRKLTDFPGTYTAAEASGAAGTGAGIATLKNGNGVRITLHSTSQGLSAQAGPEGMKITLEN